MLASIFVELSDSYAIQHLAETVPTNLTNHLFFMTARMMQRFMNEFCSNTMQGRLRVVGDLKVP